MNWKRTTDTMPQVKGQSRQGRTVNEILQPKIQPWFSAPSLPPDVFEAVVRALANTLIREYRAS